MIIYFAVFTIVLALLAVSMKGRNEEDKPALLFYIASALTLASFLGLREGVGTDYYDVYVKSFDSIALGGGSRFEPGFTALLNTISLFGLDYHWMFLIVALLTVSFVYHAVFKIAGSSIWAIFIFLIGGLFFFSTNGIRQALAVAILLNALPYAFKGDAVKYSLVVFAAALFHSSAIVFLPLYFFRNWRLNSWKTVVTVVGVGVFAGLLSQIILNIASSLFPQIRTYTAIEHLSTQYLASGNIDFSDMVLCLTPFVLYCGVRRKLGEEARRLDFPFLILLFGVLVCLMSGTISLYSRLAVYFSSFAIIAMPQLFHALDKKEVPGRFLVKTFYAIFLIASSLFLFGYLNFSEVIPYKACFQLLS